MYLRGGVVSFNFLSPPSEKWNVETTSNRRRYRREVVDVRTRRYFDEDKIACMNVPYRIVTPYGRHDWNSRKLCNFVQVLGIVETTSNRRDFDEARRWHLCVPCRILTPSLKLLKSSPLCSGFGILSKWRRFDVKSTFLQVFIFEKILVKIWVHKCVFLVGEEDMKWWRGIFF